MSNNKKSSVEWLVEVTSQMRYISAEVLEQAKAMHKEEIEEAWDNAAIDATYGNKFSSPTQYYNETFGGNNESN